MSNFSLIKSLTELSSNLTSIFALLGVIILIIAVIMIRRIKLNTKIVSYIGVVLALSTVLDLFKVFKAPFGGSVTIGSMVPIILLAIAYGPEIGLLTGFLYGLISLLLDPVILHPVQVLFDYPLPFMALGLAGYFKNKKFLGTIIAILARFICHYISGVIFWGSYAPQGMSPYVYSFVYNISYLGIDGIICLVIMALLPTKQLSYVIKK